MSGQLHVLAAFTIAERASGTHWTGSSVSLRLCVVRSTGSNPDYPAFSTSVYRLSYAGIFKIMYVLLTASVV
jgi:hypothetical protein